MSKRQVFIDIVNLLIRNPFKKILCPNCAEATLEVRDVINEKDCNQAERHIFCQNCDFETFVRINRSTMGDDDFYPAPEDKSPEAQRVFKFIDKARHK